mgnify:FL=1
MKITLLFSSHSATANVLITEDAEEIMLGIDWLEQHNCIWDFRRNILKIDGNSIVLLSKQNNGLCRRVYVDHDVELPARQQCAVPVRSTLTDLRSAGGPGMIESNQLQPGMHSARSLLTERTRDLAVRQSHR